VTALICGLPPHRACRGGGPFFNRLEEMPSCPTHGHGHRDVRAAKTQCLPAPLGIVELVRVGSRSRPNEYGLIHVRHSDATALSSTRCSPHRACPQVCRHRAQITQRAGDENLQILVCFCWGTGRFGLAELDPPSPEHADQPSSAQKRPPSAIIDWPAPRDHARRRFLRVEHCGTLYRRLARESAGCPAIACVGSDHIEVTPCVARVTAQGCF